MNGYWTRSYEHWRFVETVDEAGQPIEEWSKIGDVTGRAYSTTSNLERHSAFSAGVIQWKFACAADEDIQATDEIRFNGRRLTVEVVPETSTGRRIEANCRELTNA